MNVNDDFWMGGGGGRIWSPAFPLGTVCVHVCFCMREAAKKGGSGAVARGLLLRLPPPPPASNPYSKHKFFRVSHLLLAAFFVLIYQFLHCFSGGHLLV